VPLRLKRFLEELLKLLKEDFPAQLEKLIEDAEGLTYLQVLDDERAVITVKDRRITITGKARKGETNIRIYTNRTLLFDALEGKVALAEALAAGELKVFGDPLTLLRCYAIWERVMSLARTSPRFYFLTYELR